MCDITGRTPEELGEYRRRHPEGFDFLEIGTLARMDREAREKTTIVRLLLKALGAHIR